MKTRTKGTFDSWQFLIAEPDLVWASHRPQQLATKRVRLPKDGSNIAEYLNEIRELDKAAFEGILDAVRFVLPYRGLFSRLSRN